MTAQLQSQQAPAEDQAEVSATTARPKPGELPRPESTVGGKIFWPYIPFFVLFHLLLPLAFLPYLFSWTGVVLVFVGNYIFGSLGINLGYHRLLTHGSLKCPKWLEHFFALLGCCSLQDSPARWVAIHRMHHQHSDKQPDPHSPLVNFFWGHMGWLIVENREFGSLEMYDKYARDILQDRFYRWLHRGNRWLLLWWGHIAVLAAASYAVAWLVTDTQAAAIQFGSSLFFWGVVVRTVYVWHITWAVNSLSHRWGYRNYETGEDSRNNWFVALLTNGEGWHNNHHADQRSAAHGHRWWEFDLTYLSIVFLQKVGLAKEVLKPRVPKSRMKPA